MANPFQQQARLRKVVYTALILALFTGSLLHRKFVVQPEAENLQLREVSRGEVELTSSAVRLVLTGSRGLAVMLLWDAALKEQERHKWNEVELLVGSITKLQPYFITPWLFQSWNLAFNVAVECDKPRDKYYYVSRGMQLLAEGERRNQGTLDREGRPRFPGNPDMRHNMGFYYQLKIGTSDEKNAMQCLLDMSCIDPVERDPGRFLKTREGGRKVNDPFAEFCRKYPRLVRRLRQVLDYNTPQQVIAFLKDNQNVPSRFKEGARTREGKSLLEEAKKQFPVVPPPQSNWPDPNSYEFTTEALDVFLISRTWYSYAQLPLPPPDPDGNTSFPFDRIRYRLPRYMASLIFRNYPCRGQAYIAETLQTEGWFDQDGWVIDDWFEAEVGVGGESKYHSRRAWESAYRLYRDYGIAAAMYLTLEQRQELDRKAQLFRETYKVPPGQPKNLRADQRVGEMEISYRAHQKLCNNISNRRLTNFDAHLDEAEAERDGETVLARKAIFEAKQLVKSGQSPAKAVASFERALPGWLLVLLKHPRFRAVTAVQEEAYEIQLEYLKRLQREKAGIFQPVAVGLAELAVWPYLPLDQLLSSFLKKQRYLRQFRGPLDRVMVYSLPEGEAELKQGLLLWSQLALPCPMLVYPGQQYLLLSTTTSKRLPPRGTRWQPLIAPEAVSAARTRVRLPPLEY